MLFHLNFSKVRNDNERKKKPSFSSWNLQKYFFTYLCNFHCKNGYHIGIFIMHPFESHMFFPLYGWNLTLDGHDLNFNLCLVWFLVTPLACLRLDKNMSLSFPKLAALTHPCIFTSLVDLSFLGSNLLCLGLQHSLQWCLVSLQLKHNSLKFPTSFPLGVSSFWKPPLN